MRADEHIWASSLEKATLGSAQVLLLFQLCSWLQTETGMGKEQLSVLWEMGHVAACGAGDDPFLHVGLGQSSWIRAGISHLSSADVSQRASQKLGCKCLGSCRNCLQSWDLNRVAGGNQLPCFHVFWACLPNPCLGPLMSVFVMPVENNRKGSSAFGISARTKLNKELLYLSSLFNEKSQTTTKGNKTRMYQILGGIGKSQDFHIKKRLFHYFRNRKKKRFLVLFS